MAELFSKIRRSFWESDESRAMTMEERYFWQYLQSNSRCNTVGCYKLFKNKASDETGLTIDEIEKLLIRLENHSFILCDRTTNEVFLPHFADVYWGKKTAIKRAIAADLHCIASKALYEAAKTLLIKHGIFAAEELEKADEIKIFDGFENSGEQTGTNGNKWGLEEEEEEEKEKEKVKKEKTFASDSQEFFLFWKAYPNKKNKKTAETRWDRLNVTPELYKKIMDGLERAKASREWAKDGGEYIPHPASWLNAGGWENEYKPFAEQAAEQHRAAEPRAANVPPQEDALAERLRLMGGD